MRYKYVGESVSCTCIYRNNNYAFSVYAVEALVCVLMILIFIQCESDLKIFFGGGGVVVVVVVVYFSVSFSVEFSMFLLLLLFFFFIISVL